MKNKDSDRVMTALPILVISAVLGVLYIGLLIFMCMAVDIPDIWFWVCIAALCVFAVLLSVWFVLALFSYIVIDHENMIVKSYKGQYRFLTSDVDYVEWRKTVRGDEVIVIHLKEPVHFYRRRKTVPKKDKKEFMFIHSAKIIKLFKHYIPKDAPWIYNDYNKNPNSAP